MSENYYLPLKVENLAFYLSSACFAPAICYEQRGRDFQSLKSNGLLLFNTQLLTEDSDCCAELYLTSEERIKLQKIVDTECYVYSDILPMSRLIRVYFASDELMNHMVTQINLNTAFLPADICCVKRMQTYSVKPMLADKSQRDAEIYKKYQKYQATLGGFALMRIVKDAPYTYSRAYLPLIAQRNEHIKEIMDKAGADITSVISLSNKSLYESISAAEKDRENRANVYYNCAQQSANAIGETINIQNSKHTIITDNLSGDALVFAYLRDYRLDDNDTGARIGVDGLISSRFANVKESEMVAFYYGYSHGYSRFAKCYESVVFKFDINCLLDMYVVETLFLRTLNNKAILSVFPYIDKHHKTIAQKENLVDGEFLLLDQYVICKKKATVGSDEWFRSFFPKCAEEFTRIHTKLEKYIAPMLFQEVSQLFDIEMDCVCRTMIQKALQEKEQEKTKCVAEIGKKYVSQLKETNLKLRDEIETNHNGMLSYDEVHTSSSVQSVSSPKGRGKKTPQSKTKASSTRSKKESKSDTQTSIL